MSLPKRHSAKVVPLSDDLDGLEQSKPAMPFTEHREATETARALLLSQRKGQLPQLTTNVSVDVDGNDSYGLGENDSYGLGENTTGPDDQRYLKSHEVSNDAKKKEDRSQDIERVPLLGSYRLTLSVTCLLVVSCLSLLRSNMSVAIICMVRRPLTAGVRGTGTLFPGNVSDGLAMHVVQFNSSHDLQTPSDNSRGNQGEFDWSRATQGYVLSAYYYGYILTQIPGGWMGARFGGKKVLLGGLFLGLLCTVLTPMAARISVYMCMACRFFCGFSMGVFLPAVHSLWGKWAPPMERSLLIVLSQSGIDIGGVMAMMISGFICKLPLDGGWPFIFYINGTFTLAVLVLFSYVAYSSPNQHPRIGEKERLYINESIGPHVYTKKEVNTPWRYIVTSPAVLAIVVGHTTVNWGFYMFVSCIPMYISDVFHIDSEKMGLLSGLPFGAAFFISLLSGRVADSLRSSGTLTTASVRKLMQFAGQVIPATAVVLCGFAPTSGLAILALIGAVGFTGLTRSGYSCNHVDIAPRYAGILIGISNTVATIPGMLGPIVAGALTTNGTVDEWRSVFYLIAGVNVGGALFYCLLAEGHELPWPGNAIPPIEHIVKSDE